MKVNTDIINDYLQGKSPKDWSGNWIFYSIVDSEYLFEEVQENKKCVIKGAAELLGKELADFKPYNIEIWNVLFPEWKDTISCSTIYLVVGCPDPYDAMVRKSPEGEEVIIFDINRMLGYVDSEEKLLPIIGNLLTHEFSHKCLHSDYPVPKDNSSFLSKLQYICFDEGFAHLLSFNENIRNVSWSGMDMMQKKSRAYEMLKNAASANMSEHARLLEMADSGIFWDKFGAISGLFALADIFTQSEFNYNNVFEFYKKGPGNLLPDIFNKNIRSD